MTLLPNTSDANIRYLRDRTGADEFDCRQALIDADGDIMSAVKSLLMAGVNRFHDYYYGGPYVRVGDPNRDLPRREPNKRLEPYQKEREQNRNLDGERFFAPFSDENSLGDIEGAIGYAGMYPNWDDDAIHVYPTIQGLLMEVSDRIREKIGRSKQPRRNEFFTRALIEVEKAKNAYAGGEYDAGERYLDLADKYLRDGNKTARETTR